MKRAAYILNLVGWYCARLRHWIQGESRWRRVHLVRHVEDEPDRWDLGVLYVIKETGRPWAAAMACPCGCGNALHMNLIPDAKPVWTLKIERNGAPTLAPSVWRREGCHSHFFVRRGQIEWV
jgi:hypothetical protein